MLNGGFSSLLKEVLGAHGRRWGFASHAGEDSRSTRATGTTLWSVGHAGHGCLWNSHRGARLYRDCRVDSSSRSSGLALAGVHTQTPVSERFPRLVDVTGSRCLGGSAPGMGRASAWRDVAS